MCGTSKGKETTPVPISERAEPLPHTDIESDCDGSVTRIVRAKGEGGKGRGALVVAHLRGRGDMAITTDEVLALTRES